MYGGIVFFLVYGVFQFYLFQLFMVFFNNMVGLQMFVQFVFFMLMILGFVIGISRIVYLGNIFFDILVEEILGYVCSGQIELVCFFFDKNCVFILFLDFVLVIYFYFDVILKKFCIKGQDIKIGWGKFLQVFILVYLVVQQFGVFRNVYFGNLFEDIFEEEFCEDFGKFGVIDIIKIVCEKNIVFVYFLFIVNVIKVVFQFFQEVKWQVFCRVYYGKDWCVYVFKIQQQNVVQYFGIVFGYVYMLMGVDCDLIFSVLVQQLVVVVVVVMMVGGIINLGNWIIYFGNIYFEIIIEEICNVVCGGFLYYIWYIFDKYICFVIFIDFIVVVFFYVFSNLQGLMIYNCRFKIGWGKYFGVFFFVIVLVVSGGVLCNVYVGNFDEIWIEDRLRQDFFEYGEIELVNMLCEKSCVFVNFINIVNVIKVIEVVCGKEEYRKFKVNFGKDCCGNLFC